MMNPMINQLFSSFFSNPMQMLSQRFNIPQSVNSQDPNAIIQHLLNTGQITQAQLNQAQAQRNNPMIQQFMQNRH